MKCPNCSYNQLRGKNGMVCTKCRYQFVFDPQTPRSGCRMTDGKFLSVLAKVSRNGSYYFTEDELYHVAALRTRNKGGCIGGAIVAGGILTIGISIVFGEAFATLRFILIGILWLGLIAASVMMQRKIMPRKTWDGIVKTWKVKRGEIPGLIREAGLHEAPPKQNEPDIHDYGAANLIVCQQDIQVDWLVLNEFHSGYAALVISENGYPGYIAIKADELLQTNPDMKVFLLHDAGSEGEAMQQRILNDWPVQESQIRDLGITNAMLDTFGVNEKVREVFGVNFPLHAIPYHQLSTLLSRSITDTSGGDFTYYWAITYGEDGDLESDGDFG